MRAPLLLSLVSAAALVASACSVEERNFNTPGSGGAGGGGAGGESSVGGSGGVGGAPVSVEEACAAYAAAVCERQGACVPYIMDTTYTDQVACAARFEIFCAVLAGAPGTSRTPEGFLSCASAIMTASCADFVKGTFRGGLPECQPGPGALPDDAPCMDSGQCSSGYCNNDDFDFCGVCTARAGEGEACNAFLDCKPGLTCNIDACVPAVPEGGACAAGQTFCEPPLLCHNGICGPGAMLGEMCDPMFSACSFLNGHYCDGQTATCKAFLIAGDATNTCGLMGGESYQCPASGKCNTMVDPPMCVPAAPDDAACNPMNGPGCTPPAICYQGYCTLPRVDACGP